MAPPRRSVGAQRSFETIGAGTGSYDGVTISSWDGDDRSAGGERRARVDKEGNPLPSPVHIPGPERLHSTNVEYVPVCVCCCMCVCLWCRVWWRGQAGCLVVDVWLGGCLCGRVVVWLLLCGCGCVVVWLCVFVTTCGAVWVYQVHGRPPCSSRGFECFY